MWDGCYSDGKALEEFVEAKTPEVFLAKNPGLRSAGGYRIGEPKYTYITFAKVDTEAEQGLAAAAGISSIPTLMAFRDNILIFNQAGALAAPQLEQLIESIVALDMDEVRASIEAQETPARKAPQ